MSLSFDNIIIHYTIVDTQTSEYCKCLKRRELIIYYDLKLKLISFYEFWYPKHSVVCSIFLAELLSNYVFIENRIRAGSEG